MHVGIGSHTHTAVLQVVSLIYEVTYYNKEECNDLSDH